MEDQETSSEDKTTNYGMTLSDTVTSYHQSSSLVCDGGMVGMTDLVGSLPLPSIQSWLYPSPTTNGNLSLASCGSVVEALQQISSGVVQSESTRTTSDIEGKQSKDEKSGAQNLSLYNLVEVVGSQQNLSEDKGHSMTFDLLQDARVLAPGSTQGCVTFEEKTVHMTPILHTVPVDLFRLLRGEGISFSEDVAFAIDSSPASKDMFSGQPPKRTYKVLTTVATQTVPEQDIMTTEHEIPERNAYAERQPNGKSKLDSCRFLYQFLEAMLSDPSYDKLIKWKDKQERTFTLVDHNKVAHLWGVHKRKKSMTYDKFSRALRFYYSKNILKKESARFTYRFLTKEGSKLPF